MSHLKNKYSIVNDEVKGFRNLVGGAMVKDNGVELLIRASLRQWYSFLLSYGLNGNRFGFVYVRDGVTLSVCKMTLVV